MKKFLFLATICLLAIPMFSAQAGNLDQKDVLIKGSTDAVYYYASDGKRYVFPNQKTYNSWFSNFDGIVQVTDEELASLSLGGNVRYRPGIKLVKIQSDPKVYAVDEGGILRWIKTAQAAVDLYGTNWSKNVDDISVAFFINYTVGADIASTADFVPETVSSRVMSINTNRGMVEGTFTRKADTGVVVDDSGNNFSDDVVTNVDFSIGEIKIVDNVIDNEDYLSLSIDYVSNNGNSISDNIEFQYYLNSEDHGGGAFYPFNGTKNDIKLWSIKDTIGGNNEFRAVIDPENKIQETNENNNEKIYSLTLDEFVIFSCVSNGHKACKDKAWQTSGCDSEGVMYSSYYAGVYWDCCQAECEDDSYEYDPYSLVSCSSKGGVECDRDAESCAGSLIEGTTSDFCCDGECFARYDTQTCNQLGGTLCLGDNMSCYPTGAYSLNGLCCLEGNTCAYGYCSESGWDICESNEKCDSQVINNYRDDQCCTGNCVLKTCSEQGGEICSSSETCSGSYVSASDGTCCLGNCDKKEIKCGDFVSEDIILENDLVMNQSDCLYSSCVCLQIWSNDVTIDCNNNRIIAPSDTGDKIFKAISDATAGNDGNITIKNCIFEGFSTAIDIQDSNNVNIINNEISTAKDWLTFGVSLDDVNNALIQNNYFEYTGEGDPDALSIRESNDIEVKGNTIKNSANGVELYRVCNYNINNNEIQDAQYNGLMITDSRGVANNNNISSDGDLVRMYDDPENTCDPTAESLNLENNYWGTTSCTEIENRMSRFDWEILFDYDPILDSPGGSPINCL